MKDLGRTLASAPESALPCVLFTDLSLPGADGFELITWVRAQPRLAKMRVFVMSGSVNPADQRRAAELGVDGYLEKFPSACELRALLSKGCAVCSSRCSMMDL